MLEDLVTVYKRDYHGNLYEVRVLATRKELTRAELWNEVRPILFRDHSGQLPTKERLETIHLIENNIV